MSGNDGSLSPTSYCSVTSSQIEKTKEELASAQIKFFHQVNERIVQRKQEDKILLMLQNPFYRDDSLERLQIYIPWHVVSRSRKIYVTNIYTTSFENDIVDFPVSRLDYECQGSFATITVCFRDLPMSSLRRDLTTLAFDLNNQGRFTKNAEIPITNTICFHKLEDDSSEHRRICDLMIPAHKIDNKQCEFGDVYFICANHETERLFREKDLQSPRKLVSNWLNALYIAAKCRLTKEPSSAISAPEPKIEVIQEKRAQTFKG